MGSALALALNKNKAPNATAKMVVTVLIRRIVEPPFQGEQKKGRHPA
jgi:hypothetical protein